LRSPHRGAADLITVEAKPRNNLDGVRRAPDHVGVRAAFDVCMGRVTDALVLVDREAHGTDVRASANESALRHAPLDLEAQAPSGPLEGGTRACTRVGLQGRQRVVVAERTGDAYAALGQWMVVA